MASVRMAPLGPVGEWEESGVRRRDDRSEVILRDLATWVFMVRSKDGPGWVMAKKLGDEMLFSAACVHYRDQTDHMDSTMAVRWIRARLDEMLADVARVAA